MHDAGEDQMERRLRAAGFLEEDRGASEIVGSLLLIGITVTLVGGLSILVLNVKPPADNLHADLSLRVTRGSDGAWGTGDEQLRVQHDGGEPVPKDGLSIQVDVDGTITSYSGSGLDSPAFDDDQLTLGEIWSATLDVENDAEVNVDILLESNSGGFLLSSSRVRSAADCQPDTLAPTVLQWTQDPDDVTTLTTGAVTITAKLTDSCSGVDPDVDPHLEYRINDGTDPPYIDTGAMTAGVIDTWTGTIPSQNWTLQQGNSLQYRLTGMADTAGNSGTSVVRTDLIQFDGQDTFTNGHTDNAGTVTSFSNAQSDSDAGAAATLTESGAGATATPYYGTGATGSGGTGNASDASGASDDTYYILDSNGDTIDVTPIDTTGGSGTISQVQLVFEGHYEGVRIDDSVDLFVDPDGNGFDSVLNNYAPATSDSTQFVDITSLRPTWTFADVSNLELRAEFDRIASADAGLEFHVDALWVVVTTGGVTDMDIEFTFPTLPIAVTHVLEIDYSVSQETFYVEVFQGGTSWVQRGVALDQPTSTTWQYTLTGTELIANAGNPLIRIVDDSDASAQGTVTADYIKVVSG